MNVQNKVIVITGGAGGIGSAQAKLLARNGAEVWILDLVQEKIDQLVEELKRQGGKAHGGTGAGKGPKGSKGHGGMSRAQNTAGRNRAAQGRQGANGGGRRN